MFEKLLSVLPYNPGLLHQMSFYSRRMREEAAIRRTGMVFMVLAFMIQFFAVLAPPQSTVAASNNDLVNGGFSSAADAARNCNNNVGHYGDILANYGITCKEVADSPTVTIASTDHNRDLYSMGRLNYSIAGETPVKIGGITYYFRFLWGWDTGAPSHYQALKVIASTGKLYYLLYTCGNLVSIGLPQPVPPPPPPPPPKPVPPKFKLTKTTLKDYPVANSQVAPGTTLGYRISIDNSGGTGHDVDLLDMLPNDTTFQSMSQNAGAKVHTYHSSSQTAEWSWSTIANEVGGYTADLKVTVNARTPDGTKICNVARLSASDSGSLTSNQVCMTVKVNAPPPTPTPAPPPPPTPTVTPTCANGGLPPTSPECFQPCALNPAISATDSQCQPCQYNGSVTASDEQCKPCEASQGSQDTLACVNVSKTASDVTAGVANADGTTANPGDVILYTLYAQNTGKAAVSQYTFQEDLSDVMDYADPTDLHGGSIDSSTDVVTWPAVDIPAGQTASVQVTVTVKNPIPQTPADPGDPGHFDLTMTNTYGNTINIKVPTPPVKGVEVAAASLPNTGPGAGIFIAALIMVAGGYFYSRSRLLARESALAVQENSGA